jgi:hypothetical protein
VRLALYAGLGLLALLAVPSVRCLVRGHAELQRVPHGWRCSRCGKAAEHYEALHGGDGHVDPREARDRHVRVQRLDAVRRAAGEVA